MLTLPNLLEDVEFDEDGFLLNTQEWTHEIAEAIAAREEIELSEDHWLVIDFARSEFVIDGEAPTLRRIIKSTGLTTKEMYALFPGGPAKMACKIAGLGKPTGCI